ncbi:hypothetical protein [Streptomyces heilongjiangensis]|uniref:Uncharacterized protein n=1 Tax=Streptomyces heilongjiangensis TaxID=945052 RepID=A0ABW1BE09_9ACTN|nr:hypothetical protein [Streptomyces heilongjiangensis]MDC2948888.1 hypothetical protein [Streptomyces heilongjiangensis]
MPHSERTGPDAAAPARPRLLAARDSHLRAVRGAHAYDTPSDA